MLIGLSLGLLVAAGVYMSGARTGGGQATSAAKSYAARGTANEAASARTGAQPRAGSAAPAAASSTSASTAETRSAQPSATSSKGTHAPDPKKAGNRETQFDFYEILPQYEVVVPEVETVSPAAQTRTGVPGAGAPSTSSPPVAPVEAPGSYILQTGSFRSHGEADRMQASLALLGIESKIQKVTIDDDEFHRVRVGPIDDLDTLNRVRNQLRAAGINALVMRMND
jgi:cell division protein FtsN